MTKKVRNRVTGLVHTVNDGHWSLTHPDYERVSDQPKPRQRRKRKVSNGEK